MPAFEAAANETTTQNTENKRRLKAAPTVLLERYQSSNPMPCFGIGTDGTIANMMDPMAR
jgi:hypothetical protein